MMESVDCQELKQHIYILIDYLQSRDYSIRKLSKILFNNSIFKVQSWSGNKEKVKELSLVDSESFLENIKKILDEEYKRSLFFGKKVIVFYDLQGFSEQQFNDLEMRIEGEIENNIEAEYSKNFPYLISENILEQQSTNLFFVSCEDNESGVKKFWVCGKKSFRHRKEFILGEAPEDVQQYFQSFDIGLYDEVIAIRQDFKQLVSYITIDKNQKSITLYSDATAITSQSDMDYLSDALFKYLVSIFPDIASARKKNIGNSIRALYDEEEGRVTSFSHYTDSGSVKHEKLDRRRSDEDLRQEPYHTGGMARIQSQTEFHAIEKRWKSHTRLDLFEPMASLSYKSFMEGTTRASACYLVVVDDCAIQADLDMLTNKIYQLS